MRDVNSNESDLELAFEIEKKKMKKKKQRIIAAIVYSIQTAQQSKSSSINKLM